MLKDKNYEKNLRNSYELCHSKYFYVYNIFKSITRINCIV